MDIILIPIFILLFIAWISCFFNRWLPIQACRWMSWHLAPKAQGFDGCSFNGECPRCGKQVMQDGQGNWF